MASAPVVDPAPSAEVSDVAVGMGRTLRVAANRLVDIALVSAQIDASFLRSRT